MFLSVGYFTKFMQRNFAALRSLSSSSSPYKLSMFAITGTSTNDSCINPSTRVLPSMNESGDRRPTPRRSGPRPGSTDEVMETPSQPEQQPRRREQQDDNAIVSDVSDRIVP